MKKTFVVITVLCLFFASNELIAQKQNRELSLVFGLNQPIVTHGFNFELNYWMKNFVIDYSHGFGLELKGGLVSEEAKLQHLNFNISHSVGIGFGYRFTKNLNLRLEPKIHRWDVYYDDQFKIKAAKITSYTTYTLGLGGYYRWTPFDKKDNILKGITIVPSVRWWPNVASTLDNNELHYYNSRTGKNEIHHANNIGISNSPYFLNISVGYTFGTKHIN
jgi:hypothetical protein